MARRFVTLAGMPIVLAVLALAGSSAVLATPTILAEPYKEDADGTVTPLSKRSNRPTEFLWGAGETIKWWAWSDVAENNIPSTDWHVRDSNGVVTDRPGVWGWVRWYCSPEETLDKGDYEFWVTATDEDGTVESERYFIRMTFPPTVETRYHPTANEFLGKLARDERTAFNFGAKENGIVDSPEVKGCDNPSMFWGAGKLHFVFGDPNVNTGDPESPTRGLSGALAFTDEVVPERGIDLAHHRNWVMDETTGAAKEIIERRPGISRVNNTGGAVVPHGDGHRIWFAYYDYGSGPRESYRNYYRVGIAYSDDGFATPAARVDDLILWDKDDAGNGPNNPDPYLGYHMRVFKDHLYMMIPREGGSSPVLLRCHLGDLDNLSLDDWHWLVSVDADGVATWSTEGVSRGRIAEADFPTVDFGENADIVDTVVWNPYLNRWIAVGALGMRMWESRHLWGPYETLRVPRYFRAEQFAQSYAFFGHETMLENNGEWIHHARARSWQPLGLYGTYHQRLHMRDRLRMTVAPKSGIAGDTIEITCVNDSGWPSPSPENVTVRVDGNPATFESRDGDRYTFRYTVTGAEHGGEIGTVDVEARMEIPMDAETNWALPRDALLVVHHRNEIDTSVLSPPDGAPVSGWVPIEVDATYPAGPESLAPYEPDVRILKVELRHAGGTEEVVTADVEPPYTLWVNTARYPDGPLPLRVVAYDTIDRRGEATITLDVRNLAPVAVAGNRIADGDMEDPGIDAWTPLYNAVLEKIEGEDHRNGRRSLRVVSDAPASWAGFRQTVTGLRGGERLRFSAWGRLRNNYTAQLRWNLYDGQGLSLAAKYVSSYGYFRRMLFEFDNPPGNAEVRVDLIVRDTGSEGVVAGEGVATVEAIVDDLVLRPACHPVVDPPADVRTEVLPAGDAVLVTWTGTTDVGVEFYAVDRRPVAGGEETWERLGEVRARRTSFTDDTLPGPAEQYEYRVVAIDAMGWDSETTAPDPIGEVSDVAEGDPPLRVAGPASPGLTVAKEPGAVAYNVYADAIGSWGSPSGGTGSVCSVTSWTDNGDGTVTLDYAVPVDSWVVVTASDACTEGPAGTGIDGTERSLAGAWSACGALP